MGGVGGKIGRFGGEIYKESRSWCSLFVGVSSLFVAPSGEHLALPKCWKGISLSTIFRVSVPIFCSGQSIVVYVEGMEFGPRVVVVGR